MSRFQVSLWSEAARVKVIDMVRKAPSGYRVTIHEPKRSTEQNNRLWHMLTQISVSYAHHGQRLSPDDWKVLFMASLNREIRMVPNLDNDGFVQLGRSSSKLSKSEMTDLMTLIEAFAAQNQIDLKLEET